MRRGKIYLNDIYLRGDADGRRKWFYLCLWCRILALSGWHLKNFSLYDTGMGYSLTPAYHLLSTVIVMPEDTEELALTLNGKKRKIWRSDFEKSIIASGVSGKVIENIARKFRRSIIKWMELIDVSFLPEDMKKPYKRLVLQRLLWLRWKIFPFLF